MNRNAIRIARTKSFSEKNEKFCELSPLDREACLESFILGLPADAYLVHTEGRAARHLPTVVSEILGCFAGIEVTKTFMSGMASRYPQKIAVSFTHGLDAVYVK